MMNDKEVFGTYSKYYSLLYKDKDYTGEARFVQDLIRKYHPDAKTILDLGCGTGMHSMLLAEKGYDVTGVDMSEGMLSAARSHLASSRFCSSAVQFVQNDIREVRLNRSFDIIVSLFHVLSYQVTNDDLLSVFATVKAHLSPAGIFLFDCWYGPAVLTDRPAVRIKRLEDDEVSITRIAEPEMHPNSNIVDVKYHIIVKNKANDHYDEIRETHRMRYLFKPEIELLLKTSGLRIEDAFEWVTGKRTGFDTWSVCFVVRL
jgi:SAM-dependent methyltransferase